MIITEFNDRYSMSLQILSDTESAHIEIPDKITKIYNVLETEFLSYKHWNEMHEKTLWRHLCMCILSSNVTYELAKSALGHLAKMKMLDPVGLLENHLMKKIIANELSKPIYLPQKKDGTLRKYRFPLMRAKNIVDAAFTIYSKQNGIRRFLHNSNSEQYARKFLIENVSGLGLKEASHFLRNIKYSTSLAIIDVHIISFLNEMGLLTNQKNVTAKNYYHIEEIMQQIAARHGFNLSILDNAIWYYMKYRTDS